MKFWWWLLLLPTVALAKTENWPERYNFGEAAYRSYQALGIGMVESTR